MDVWGFLEELALRLAQAVKDRPWRWHCGLPMAGHQKSLDRQLPQSLQLGW